MKKTFLKCYKTLKLMNNKFKLQKLKTKIVKHRIKLIQTQIKYKKLKKWFLTKQSGLTLMKKQDLFSTTQRQRLKLQKKNKCWKIKEIELICQLITMIHQVRQHLLLTKQVFIKSRKLEIKGPISQLNSKTKDKIME